MEQTDLINRLLALSTLHLDQEALDAVLEHEKWKLRETHRHEKEMRQLELRMGVAVAPTPSAQSNVDSDFNSETSHNQCGPEHIGLIAKTKVGLGASLRAKELQNPDKLPVQLLALAITISWCGERMGKWPSAKDTKVALGLRNDLTKSVEEFGPVKVIKAVDLVSESLIVWDPRIVSEQLDNIRVESDRIRSMMVSGSPLFAEFRKNHPQIDPELFDSCYNQNNGNFTEAALYLLRRQFKTLPPKELEHIDGWGQRWQQYLPSYLQKWRSDLKSMENRMRTAQRAWKESMS
jgi:hypothetical protein